MSDPRNESDATPPSAAGRRLTVLYIFALSTVALLSLGAQWLVQRQLQNGESDSRVINIAGRQRMLSQRLAKAALESGDPSHPGRTDRGRELDETLILWAESHEGLQHGDIAQGLPGDNSPAIRALFEVIEPHFQAMHSAAKRLTQESVQADTAAAAVANILRHEGDFLAGMDAIVSQYVAEAEQRVTRLRRLEMILLCLTLTVLLAEGLFIFRPAVRRIEQAVKRLADFSDRLRAARDEAESANAAKTRFLANVSHELRTPMTAVLGMTELARDATDDAQRQEFLAIAEEAGETLLALLNDLIDLARIESGRLLLDSQPFSLRDSLDRVVRLLKPSAVAKGITLGAEAAPPEAIPQVLGDARRLEQVLLNLVSNAVKWTDRGGVTIRCLTEQTTSTVGFRLLVEDTGPGISEEDKLRVFEPFEQVGSGNQTRGGDGLGLAICRRLADAMGASLEIESSPSVGTTVVFSGELPLATHEQADTEDSPGDTPKQAAGRVLVVEDTEVNRLLLQNFLESATLEVEMAVDGEQALSLYEKQNFDVALIDLRLPGIGGAETARKIVALCEAQGRPRPVMVCVTADTAAFSDPQTRGVFDAVVSKPIQRAELLRQIGATPQQQAPPDTSDTSTLIDYDTDLAEAFLQVASDQREELASALGEGRLDTARVLAHRFAGQVVYFSGDSLRTELERLEACCLARDIENVAALAPAVLASLDQLIESLSESLALTAPS